MMMKAAANNSGAKDPHLNGLNNVLQMQKLVVKKPYKDLLLNTTENTIYVVKENIVIFQSELQMNQIPLNQFNAAVCQLLKNQMIQKVSAVIPDML